MRRTRLLPLLVTALTLLAPAASGAPDAGDREQSVTWALSPATGSEPDGRVSLRHVLEPGTGTSDSLALSNLSDRPATFAVYAAGGTVAADGSFDLATDAASGGSWVSVGEAGASSVRDGGGITVRLDAGDQLLVPVGIAVPEDATPGDHPAGVVAELVPDEPAQVEVASRVGVRVHLRVAGDLVAEVAATDVTTDYTPSWNPFTPGSLTVSFAVANTGNVRLGTTSEVSARGPFGVGAAGAGATAREILPGGSARASVTVPAWPLGRTSGDVTTLPAVVGDDVVDVALLPATTTFTAWTVPWVPLALLALLTGAVLLVRRQRARTAALVQARVEAAVAAATHPRVDIPAAREA